MPELRSNARRDRANKNPKPNQKNPIALKQSPVRRNPRRQKKKVVVKETIVEAEKATPLVKEEEEIRVSREDKKMDENDSGGQAAPVPDDEGNTPPLPEKVSPLLLVLLFLRSFSSWELSLALCVVFLIRACH